MKIAFKVINIIIIVLLVLSILKALFTSGILIAALLAVVSLVELFMAIEGFKGNYSQCKKLSFVVLVFSVINVFLSAFSLESLFLLALVIAYVVMCISLESKSY